ncbi:MAG: Hint domain-containing protein [Myxococcales bacterium]|nr:Hint domain-containing protein [Myxococcales bacterium]
MKKLLMGLGVASSLAACGPFYCVARGARVKTPTGPRPIEDLEVGDEIVVADPATGMTAVSRLEAIIKSTRECGTLRFSGRALSVTSDHPLYDPQARGFFPAGDWLLGLRTHLFEITDSGAVVVPVENFDAFTRIDDVFDLTVAHEWHTFIAEGVLVHNKQPPEVTCTTPTGQTVRSYSPGPACSCADGGIGQWDCDSAGSASCERCTAPDGGSSDGGSADGGP